LQNNTNDLVNFSRFITNKYYLGNGTDFDALYGKWEADTIAFADWRNSSMDTYLIGQNFYRNATSVIYGGGFQLVNGTDFDFLYGESDTTCGISGICSTVYQGASTLDSLYVSRNTWTDIDDYPSDCSAGSYVTGLADSLTCTADPMDTIAEWQSLCTNCIDNTDLGLNSVDLVSDALSSDYAGDGLSGGGTLALAVNAGDGLAISADAVIFDCSDVTATANDGIGCSGEDLTVAGGTCLTADASGLGVTPNCIGATQLAYDTNQHLNTTSDVTFANLQINEKITSDDTVFIDDTLNVSGYLTALSDIQINSAGLCIDGSGTCTVTDGRLEIENGSLCIDDDGSLDCSGTTEPGDLYIYDGLLSVAEADAVSCTYATTDGEICAEYVIEGNNVYASDFFDDGTNINTIYLTTETGDISEVVESGTTPLTFTGCDTGSCAIGLSTDLLSHDTSPQLSGYLDTNGQNIGSTADEIENIYISTNSKIYLGNGQESEIYYNGTALRLKVT
ncbi:MAG: hypothetical protein ACTSSP_05590, partial [Candidatus Asgardarchaeia archaeon]